MSTNRTSAAAEQMRKGSIADLISRPVRVSIGQKYKRMEDALNEIASWSEGETVTGGFDEPCSAAKAREALAFDPLSTSFSSSSS